jgi:hypothetical protein
MPCGLCYLRIRGPDLLPQPRADKAERDEPANNAFAFGRPGTLNEAPAGAHATYVAPASAGLVCRSSRAQTMPSAMITTALASKVGILPTFKMPNP